MKDSLADRKQQVIINGSKSEWVNITSGIPQGNVLKSILFLVFINDLPDAMTVCMKLFADDGKLFSKVKTQENRLAVQGNVNQSELWADIYRICFTPRKIVTIYMWATIQMLGITQ